MCKVLSFISATKEGKKKKMEKNDVLGLEKGEIAQQYGILPCMGPMQD